MASQLARRTPVIRVVPERVRETRVPPKRPTASPGGAQRVRTPLREREGLSRDSGGFSGFQAPTGYQHVLMAEMIVAFVVIGIRAIADYAPDSDMNKPGSEQPNKGASPIVLITATLGVFFVLSFLATRGGNAAKASAAFGLLMIIALMINSESELAQVASWIENIGTNSTNEQSQASDNSGNSGTTSGNVPPSVLHAPGLFNVFPGLRTWLKNHGVPIP